LRRPGWGGFLGDCQVKSCEVPEVIPQRTRTVLVTGLRLGKGVRRAPYWPLCASGRRGHHSQVRLDVRVEWVRELVLLFD